ncbi:LacI family DNA-binding transcriptional regulator [Streptomyces rugosispiralis]|uniref:LacI family transcriptional regulator n=1 Tax=Streptomyces rugosispiralis TaxID=2967341 RepID=A0ABT1URN3_9ACTN|nr:LacI family DNA-binding transcriptional regulator [Streptomyces rugosispiralis]MCQ8187782.1 LacI family transcriptional regulator [Streptomyces rugosispiralis]
MNEPEPSSGRPAVVRMRDVAAVVGVSVKTVSNVVNATGQVNEATVRAVRAAVEELGYRPNPLARGLNSRATDTVTLALPGLGYGYCAPLAAAVFDLAEAEGISVVMEPTGGDRERELEVLRNRGGLSDGVLLMPTAITARDLKDLPSPAPAVLLGSRRVEGPFDSVASRDAVAAEAAVRLLLDRGASRVVLLGGERKAGGDSAAALRTGGYRRALTAAGLKSDPSLVVETSQSSRGDGHTAIARLLGGETPFDAVLALEEPLAHGALHALRGAGRDVPGRVQVVAFGNDEDAEYSWPSLTTVQADVRTMARRALDLLTARVREGARPRSHVEVPLTITERESTFS